MTAWFGPLFATSEEFSGTYSILKSYLKAKEPNFIKKN